MQRPGRFRSPPRQNQFANHNHNSSFASSSDDSYGRMNSLSRSESGTSQTHYDDFTNIPSPKVLMNGYARDGFDWDGPDTHPSDRRRAGRVPDENTMHLLVETAVGDSSGYDILSVEELEQLKKDEAAIARRIPGLKRELELESRVRDAARSVSRLSENRANQSAVGKGRGFEGLSDDDFHTSSRKCDEMAQELWQLEKRQSLFRDKRLQHTARVLQMYYEQKTGQDGFSKSNKWTDSDSWASGFNLNGLAPGGLADTADGIMDIPGSSQKTDNMLSDLWNLLEPGAASGRDKGLSRNGASTSQSDFSHEAFQAKVRNLCSRASSLENQLVQERDFRSQNESNKSAEKTRLIEQLQDAHDKHMSAQKKLEDAHADHMEARGQLDQTKQEMAYIRQQYEYENKAERESRQALETDLRSQLQQKERTIATLQSSDSSSTGKVAELNASLRAAEQKAQQDQRRMTELDNERADLDAELVRLQTEVTVARAELDGAYGTRAQRAAEVADNPEIRKRLDEVSQEKDAVTKRVEMLQKELGDLVTEHESLVRQGVDSEKERESMESTVDSLREKVEALEVKLGDEKVRTMARKGSGSSNGVSTSGTAGGHGEREPTSMSVMRNEFKKMMRDARADHFRNMRVSTYLFLGQQTMLMILQMEQEERRRLEAMVRAMRKEHGAPSSPSTLSPPPIGRSGLSKSMTAN